MLYTRKGDTGKTSTFGCNQKISKSSNIAEALGSLDETNSLIGVCKILSKKFGQVVEVNGTEIGALLHGVQETLFSVQAEFAGAPKKIGAEKVTEIESKIDWVEKELPPIKTFFISGGTELSTALDYARTVARRAERRCVTVKEEGLVEIGEATLAFLNRLSSLLYALSRLINHKSGIAEEAPSYK